MQALQNENEYLHLFIDLLRNHLEWYQHRFMCMVCKVKPRSVQFEKCCHFNCCWSCALTRKGRCPLSDVIVHRMRMCDYTEQQLTRHISVKTTYRSEPVRAPMKMNCTYCLNSGCPFTFMQVPDGWACNICVYKKFDPFGWSRVSAIPIAPKPVSRGVSGINQIHNTTG
jgi:hypothetical protein